MLTGEFRLSRRDVAALLTRLLGVPICKATVQACCERVSRAIAQPVRAAEASLANAERLWADETGWRQGRARRWLWLGATEAVACFALHPRRGAPQLDRWFPAALPGVLHSDRWSAYGRFDPEHRQLCWAHLRRDLKGIVDARGAGAAPAAEVLQGADRLFERWHAFCRGEIDRPTLQADTRAFREAFHAFCAEGDAQRAERKWHGLGRDARRWWPAVFRFIDVERVEPTNNRAERHLRHAVLWRRISQGTRSDAGSEFVARILTAAATCALQGRDLLAYLRDCLLALLRGEPAPSLIPDTS